jgi:two-component system response regulator HydG
MASEKILIVEDDPQHLFMLVTLTGDWGYASHQAKSGREALDLLAGERFSLVLMDVRLGAEPDGLTVFRKMREGGPNQGTPVIIMTALMNYPDAVQSIKDGASDYLTKPLDFEALRKSMDKALRETKEGPGPKESPRHAGRAREDPGAAAAEPAIEDFFLSAESPGFQEVLKKVELAAPTDAQVLITGESGTGKEVVARLIQSKSRRRAGPFVTVNCAGLPDNLVESALFGHRKGAFTGADANRVGLIKMGDGGTVFLDEIAETSLSFQSKLLRTIQQQEIQPLGSDKSEKVNVRFIAATNKDIKREAQERRFREDLYYRLNVINIHVPPLRERREDIVPLARFFVKAFAEKNGKEIRGLSHAAERAAQRCRWAGNIRELMNAMERAVIFSNADVIDENSIPRDDQDEHGAPAEHPLRLDLAEKAAVEEALRQAGGNKSEAARILGVTRKTLSAKLAKFGIADKPDK